MKNGDANGEAVGGESGNDQEEHEEWNGIESNDEPEADAKSKDTATAPAPSSLKSILKKPKKHTKAPATKDALSRIDFSLLNEEEAFDEDCEY